MRISFTYNGTQRHGQLLGVIQGTVEPLLVVKEDNENHQKHFKTSQVRDVTSVLEPHEQMPGIISRPLAEGDIPQVLANLATEQSKFTAKFKSVSEDLDNIFQRLQKLETFAPNDATSRILELENKLDDVRIALLELENKLDDVRIALTD